MDAQEFCERAVRESDPANIPYYAYFGDLPLGETWATTFSHHRDSDDLDESNWEVITNDLIDRFPEDTQIEGSSHWAVGWSESLCVRMLDENKEPTEAALAVIEWKEALEHYPVADEEDYSRREWETANENWRWTGMRTRIKLCAEQGISIFAARHDCIPQDDDYHIFEYMTGR
jgi:hypothetical protein